MVKMQVSHHHIGLNTMTNTKKITILLHTMDAMVAHVEFQAKQVDNESDYRELMAMVEVMEKTMAEVRGINEK